MNNNNIYNTNVLDKIQLLNMARDISRVEKRKGNILSQKTIKVAEIIFCADDDYPLHPFYYAILDDDDTCYVIGDFVLVSGINCNRIGILNNIMIREDAKKFWSHDITEQVICNLFENLENFKYILNNLTQYYNQEKDDDKLKYVHTLLNHNSVRSNSSSTFYTTLPHTQHYNITIPDIIERDVAVDDAEVQITIPHAEIEVETIVHNF